MESRGNLARPHSKMATTLCVTNKCSQMKLEVNEGESDDEEEVSNKSSLISIVTTLSKLKRKVVINRGVNVTEKMESNSAKLLKYTSCLRDSSKQWADKSSPEEDKLTFRSQKVLCNFSNTDADGKDDGQTVAAPIILGSTSGGKTSLRPLKLIPHPNVPPYTSWIYLDRNQRMTEDQSVQGRRRIYYDPVGNETLIASDSEEEEPEDEEPKHDFSKGEDYIIWTAVQERGASGLLFEQIAQCIHVKREEVQARYELLLKDVGKQAKCEAHGDGIRSKVPSPAGRRKGTRDLGRLAFKETHHGPNAVAYLKTGGNGITLKIEEEKVEAKDLVAAMDSFDNLFCRRCLVFDCRLHGCSQPLVHPSERQPSASANTDSESMVPCGPHCHLLSQHAQGNTSIACIAGVSTSKAADLPSSAEGAEGPRVAKRQKTLEGDTCWVGENVEGAATTVDGAKLRALSAQVHTNVDKVGKLSVIKEGSDSIPGGTAQTPLMIGHKDVYQSQKRERHPVASRLTSHKKLARSTSRRAIEENGSIGGDSHRCQAQITVIDLTGTDEGFPIEKGTGPAKELVGGMIGNTTEGLTEPYQLQVNHVSKELTNGKEAIFQQEKTRFSSTKRLARSTKRALEDHLISSVEVKRHQAQGGPMNLGQHEVDTNMQDVTDVPSGRKVARTVENETQLKVVGTPSTLPSSAGGVEMDICQTRFDPLKEKSKVTSPKKLARSARKPVTGKLVGMSEAQEPQTIGNLLASSQEEKRPVREEKTRNTAARKLARSARKVFAEKVAVAIQQQQLLSSVDVVSKIRVEKEQAQERFDAGGSHKQVSVTTTTTAVVSVIGSESLAPLTKPDKICALGSSELVDKNRDTLGDFGENGKIVEVKQDQEPAGSTKAGALVEHPVSTREDTTKKVELRDNWTALEKGLYEKGLQIFGKSSCMIANNMLKGCKTCAEVGEYIVAQDAAALGGAEAGLHQFPDSLACVLKWDVARARARFYGRRKGSRKLKFTLKSAGQSAIRKRMANGKDAPCRQYTPCGCLFTCGKQCPCQLSGTCCEKYCGCAKGCKNRFRGCHCAKSQCCSRQCPCFAAGRECDPDVCRNCWTGCGDGKLAGPPQREDKDNYQCHNMKLLLKQQQRVLLSRSDVAGWGAFLKNSVSKHEYLGEYTGELISHREADKRGKIYDRENSSFLFNLNDQYVLDACRKGDKLKFANHSPNPNCYAKVIMVAGDHRVGIFAKERILAGEELFYDYRYEADRAPAWARRGDDSSNGKRDDTGPSERRSKQAS